MKRILCSLIVAALPFGAAFAQTAPQPIVAPVMQKDLADMPGREMLMLSVEYPPRNRGAHPSARCVRLRLRAGRVDRRRGQGRQGGNPDARTDFLRRA